MRVLWDTVPARGQRLTAVRPTRGALRVSAARGGGKQLSVRRSLRCVSSPLALPGVWAADECHKRMQRRWRSTSRPG